MRHVSSRPFRPFGIRDRGSWGAGLADPRVLRDWPLSTTRLRDTITGRSCSSFHLPYVSRFRPGRMPCEALDPPEYLPIPALRQIALGQLEDEKYRACRLRQPTRLPARASFRDAGTGWVKTRSTLFVHTTCTGRRRWVSNRKFAGSNPAPATTKTAALPKRSGSGTTICPLGSPRRMRQEVPRVGRGLLALRKLNGWAGPIAAEG